MVSAETLVAFTVPFSLTWLFYLLLLAEHMVHRFNIKFQALSLRITVAFPFVSTINYLNAFVSLEVFAWINVTTGVAEGLLLLEFFALLVGWSWSRGGNVFEAMLEAPQTKRRCWWRCCGSCGKSFTDGREALNNLLIQVAQYAVIKPCTDIVEAIVHMVGNKDVQQMERILQVLDIISVILALRALLMLYVVLKRFKDPETKQGYLVGLNAVSKFMLIKLLFGFIVLNNLVLTILAAFNSLEIPSWICSQNETSQHLEECTSLFKSFIFLVESACASLAAVHLFRSKGLCYPEIFGNFENYPGEHGEDRSIASLLKTSCRFWDLNTYIWPDEEPPAQKEKLEKPSSGDEPIEQQQSHELVQEGDTTQADPRPNSVCKM